MKKLELPLYDAHVLVCRGGKCNKQAGPEVVRSLRRSLRDRGLRTRVSQTSCMGQCKHGCVVVLTGDAPKMWGQVREEDTPKLAKKIDKQLQKALRKAS